MDIIESLIISVIIFVVGYYWDVIMRPYLHTIFFGKKIPKFSGNWEATYDDGTKDKIVLKQFASKIWGEMKVNKGKDKGDIYSIKGSYKEPYITLEYRLVELISNQKNDGGSIFLKIIDDTKLKGGMLSINDDKTHNWKGEWEKVT